MTNEKLKALNDLSNEIITVEATLKTISNKIENLNGKRDLQEFIHYNPLFSSLYKERQQVKRTHEISISSYRELKALESEKDFLEQYLIYLNDQFKEMD